MYGEKTISPGRYSNSLQVEGTLKLFNFTTLFDGAQVYGEGKIILERESVLDVRGKSGIFISPSFVMQENSTLMMQVDEKDKFALRLHQLGELEDDVVQGNLILSLSKGSELEEGGIYSIASTSQESIHFSSVKWEGHQFEMEYNASGIFVVFQGDESFSYSILYLIFFGRNRLG